MSLLDLLDSIALPIVVAIITQTAAYFINQLPEMRNFLGRPWLLSRLTLWLVLLIFALRTPESFDKADDAMLSGASLDIAMLIGQYMVVATIVAIVFDSCALIGMLRGGQKDADNLLSSLDVRSRLIAEHHRMVRQRLDYAIGEYEPINLVVQAQPKAVGRRGDNTEKILLNSVKNLRQRLRQINLLRDSKGDETNSRSALLSTFEDDDVGGRLLILGDPGSGKTTILLKLTDELLERAKGTGQIPYIFELSSWRNNQKSLADWMMAQLELDYKIDPSVSRDWIVSGQLVPLLDGLDEVKPSYTASCIEKINEFVLCTSMPQIVVCCRTRQYKESRASLDSLNRALQLKPLKDAQIEKYFKNSGRKNIWKAIEKESGLNALLKPSKSPLDRTEKSADTENDSLPILRVPLFLQLLTVAYQSGEPLASKEDLFDAYIDRKLSLETREWDRRQGTPTGKSAKWAYESLEKEPSIEETKKYLGWLSKHLLETECRNDFLIEQLQPTWLKSSLQRWLYRLIFGLSIGLISGVILRRIIGLPGGILSGLVFGLIFGVAGEPIGGLIFGIEDINPVERIVFSFSKFEKEKFINNLAFGLLIGLAGGLIAGLVGGLTENIVGGLLFSLVFGLLGGLRSGLQEKIMMRRIPNQGILASARNLFLITPCLYPAGIAIPTIQRVLLKSDMSFQQSIVYGYSYTLLIGFSLCGGLAVTQHIILRFLLWREGAIPWNYARFLQYTTERRLTQRVGGHFRFIHRELLEHFANEYSSLQENKGKKIIPWT